jgi:hypothetical protein
MIGILMSVLALASTIPLEKRPATFDSDRRLIAVGMAHQYEYILGAIAWTAIAVMTWRSKYQPDAVTNEHSPALESVAGPVSNGKSSPPAQ